MFLKVMRGVSAEWVADLSFQVLQLKRSSG